MLLRAMSDQTLLPQNGQIMHNLTFREVQFSKITRSASRYEDTKIQSFQGDNSLFRAKTDAKCLDAQIFHLSQLAL